jgi:hypothetical protein
MGLKSRQNRANSFFLDLCLEVVLALQRNFGIEQQFLLPVTLQTFFESFPCWLESADRAGVPIARRRVRTIVALRTPNSELRTRNPRTANGER